MKIEAGKYYRTRDGRKVGPMIDNPQADWQADKWVFGTADSPHGYSWQRDGRFSARDKADPLDLVSEWTDEPTGPVRVVTSKAIVPGTYARLRVGLGGTDEVVLNLTDRNGEMIDRGNFNATELRAAAATLLEIADALVKP